MTTVTGATKLIVEAISGATVEEDIIALLTAAAYTVGEVGSVTAPGLSTDIILSMMEDNVTLTTGLHPHLNGMKIRALCY